MAPDIYQVADRYKRALIARETGAVREIRSYYRQAEKRIAERLSKLVADIETWQKEHPSEQVPSWWLFERDRLQALRAEVEEQLSRFAQLADGRIRSEQEWMVERAQRDAQRLAAAGLGLRQPGVTVSWVRLPDWALEQMVGTLQDGSPLRSLLDALGPAASETVRHELVGGLAMGRNPRDVARRIREALNNNRVRAETIARTEMLRSYRQATLHSYAANSDLVQGWVWHSARDGRTCVLCWAMHGTVHPLSEPFASHPRCRCTMVPLTRSWQELGVSGVPETRRRVEAGEKLFAALTQEQQRAVLGNAAFEAYKSGLASLSDFVGERYDARWGLVRYVRSLREVLDYAVQRETVGVNQ